MNPYHVIERGLFAASMATVLLVPRPAAANGAASTRNILFGTAAAAAGTLLIINHNKQVHARYAEDERRQAAAEAQANQSAAAYASERSAYAHQSAILRAYKQEAAYRQRQVEARDREIGTLKHSLVVAKYGAARTPAYATRVAAVPVRALHPSTPAANVATQHVKSSLVLMPQTVAPSYGWGTW